MEDKLYKKVKNQKVQINVIYYLFRIGNGGKYSWNNHHHADSFIKLFLKKKKGIKNNYLYLGVFLNLIRLYLMICGV